MSTTVTNTNPITITGGTMAAGARATIYPGQIVRSFKVIAVGFISTVANSTFSINDNTTANNLLIQGQGPVTVNSVPMPIITTFPVPLTWADWKLTALSTAADKVLVYIK